VMRDGKPVEVSIKIGDRANVLADNTAGDNDSPEGEEGQPTHARLGISVQNLSAADREQIGLKSSGVVIGSVEPGSFAEDIGLQKGDVIVAINRHPVNSATDVRDLMQSAKPGEAVAFKLLRNTGGNWNPLFTAGTLSEK